jgi:hypothetical protein
VRWRLTQRGCGLAGVVLILFYASSLWRHFQPWYKQRPKSSKKQKSFSWDTQYYSLNWSLSLVVILMDGGWTTQREPLAYLYVVNRAIYSSGWCALYKLFLLGAFFLSYKHLIKILRSAIVVGWRAQYPCLFAPLRFFFLSRSMHKKESLKPAILI